MRKYDNKTLILAGVMFVVILLLTWQTHLADFPDRGKPNGYWTLGDVGIYVTAVLLGGPLAAICAAVGTALADVIVGQAVYAPASLIAKALMVLIFTAHAKRGHSILHLVKSVAISSGVMVLAYFLYDLIFRGDYILASVTLTFRSIQGVLTGLLTVPVLFLMGGKTYRQGGGFSSHRDDFPTTPKRQLK